MALFKLISFIVQYKYSLFAIPTYEYEKEQKEVKLKLKSTPFLNQESNPPGHSYSWQITSKILSNIWKNVGNKTRRPQKKKAPA